LFSLFVVRGHVGMANEWFVVKPMLYVTRKNVLKCHVCGRQLHVGESAYRQICNRGKRRYFCGDCVNENQPDVIISQLRGFGEGNYKFNNVDKRLLERYEAYLAVKQFEGGDKQR